MRVGDECEGSAAGSTPVDGFWGRALSTPWLLLRIPSPFVGQNVAHNDRGYWPSS